MDAVTTNKSLQVEINNRQILKIAMPIAVSILVPQINFITNNIFLGGLGEQPLAVAGITGVYYLIFAVMGFGLNNGLQALIARRAGENRLHEIGNLFNHGIRITLVISAFSIIVTYLLAPVIFSFALHDETNVQMAIHFLYIRIWGLPFLYLYQMRNALLVGTNQSKWLIWGTLAETLTNIILDYALIYGQFGLPQMGFNGAAVASIIAEATGLLVMFFVIHKKGVADGFNIFGKHAYDGATIKLILNQSLPLIMQYVISVGSWEFFYILVEHHGERNLAISNTMRNIFGLFGCVTWAFAAASTTMVSNIIGQGLQHRVIELVTKITRLSVSFALIIFLLLNIAPALLLQVYGQSEDFIVAAVPVVRVVSVALIMMSFGTVWLNAVIGTGNTRINLAIEFAAITVYSIYAYIILERLFLSITIGWTAEWVYWFCMFTPAFFYLKSGKWKNKKI
ncbi:MATE family efflux transporter [Panacibacter ginsenosidivorans]|uniref:Multidrug-efflux transporter n=1 Tax=Panacibacter ginsenosidivorans TaxID=1813871 RepID=A0A5B8VAJ7_9BACT|nr:MATE family efflux transporter [Panacibacter ginsenosidivorans]QEC67328.1 MATE family efflux transporter [Panacibacter ginsenosidivorans]